MQQSDLQQSEPPTKPSKAGSNYNHETAMVAITRISITGGGIVYLLKEAIISPLVGTLALVAIAVPASAREIIHLLKGGKK